MFERLMLKAAALANEAARRRRSALAEALGAEAPDGVWVSEDEDDVVLRGRGIRRRFALETRLRWFTVGRLDQVRRGRPR